MTEYGHTFDTNFDPNKENTYNVISVYFDNPTMTKIQDSEKYSTYSVKIKNLLSDPRFIIAMVDKDNFPLGKPFRLNKLKWISLQTRKLEDNPNVLKCSYQRKNNSPFNSKIYLVDRKEEITTYISQELPIKVSLLHKNRNTHEFPDEGTITTALETYQSVLTFN